MKSNHLLLVINLQTMRREQVGAAQTFRAGTDEDEQSHFNAEPFERHVESFVTVTLPDSECRIDLARRDRVRRIERLFADDQRVGETGVDEKIGAALSEVEVQPRLVEFIQNPVHGRRLLRL